MANGVRFGNCHTWTDFGLSMGEECFDVGMPEVAENYVEVQGGVPLDLSDLPGEHPTYKMRPMKGSFMGKLSARPWPQTVSMVQNAIHGEAVDIILDEDPNWKYHGRVKVKPAVGEGLARLDIEVTALPYKEYIHSMKESGQWSKTDFGMGSGSYDAGFNSFAFSTNKVIAFPPSVCFPVLKATVTVTGLQSGSSDGTIAIRTGGSIAASRSVSASGTYVVQAPVSKVLGQNDGLHITGLVGSVTVDYVPRSF